MIEKKNYFIRFHLNYYQMIIFLLSVKEIEVVCGCIGSQKLN